MEQVLEEMCDDGKESQEEAALQVARSSRRDPYTFKRKGNENQHAFNDDVEDKLVQAKAHLGRVEEGEEGNERLTGPGLVSPCCKAIRSCARQQS